MNEAVWVDLIDVAVDDRVLLVDAGAARALPALEAITAHVRPLSPGALTGADLPDGGFDLVCVDDVRLAEADLLRLRRSLAPTGRLVVVVDNALSPLRAVDRTRGRPRGAASRAGLRRTVGALGRTGLEVEQAFALLRSSVEPVTAFDVRSAAGRRATIGATLSHVGGVRGLLLRRLVRLPGPVVAALAPAWLVVARPPGHEAAPHRIVGKIGNRDSDEFKIVRGDPPAVLEKHYAISTPRAEVVALTELERVGFPLAPRVVGVPGPAVCRFSWLGGDPLVVERLDDDDLVAWTARAARLLARLQDLTRHPDGTVLVHGDLWLGNLLVTGDEISGVVDWTRARRGSPEVDRRFLVDSVDEHRTDPALRRRLERARDEALPASGYPDPVACLLGGDTTAPSTTDVLPPGVPVARFGGTGDGDLALLVDWARQQPVPPVLVPVSRDAVRLLSRHRDVLEPVLRFLLPPAPVVADLDASGTSGHPRPTGETYHAYVNPEGEVVGEHTAVPHSRDGCRIGARPDALALGRRVVDDLALRGVVTVHLGRDDGGHEGPHRVDLFVDAASGRPRAAARAGVDVAGSLLRRPGRSAPAAGRPSRTRRHRRAGTTAVAPPQVISAAPVTRSSWWSGQEPADRPRW